MNKHFLTLGLIFVVMLTGCKDNEGITYETEISQVVEKEIATIEYEELEKKLNNAKIKIEELEKQIVDLNKQLKNTENQENIDGDLPTNYELRIITVDEKEIKYIIDKTHIASQPISIIGYNIDRMVESYEKIQIKGLGEGEHFKAEVIGSIYDFQLIELKWNEETDNLDEVRVIDELEEVRNQAVYIETYLSCGMPNQKIKWKDSTGNTHEIYLANDGYGFDGSIIWSE
ncbi:hypothetical protein [Vallitalea maricola]|uniref:Uncharacterized protein n=1 Tax=Vallitalea maricola TaxID=3074433 RepID=A0ACB5UHK7_9FIRM|nr:hypothetical protein AN2V17_16740 [Vallitalea sp. AN17-2]